jgi:hypothetical protein
LKFFLNHKPPQSIPSDRSFGKPNRKEVILLLYHQRRSLQTRLGIALLINLLFLLSLLLFMSLFLLPFLEDYCIYFGTDPLLISFLRICVLENEGFTPDFQK